MKRACKRHYTQDNVPIAIGNASSPVKSGQAIQP